MSEYTGCDKCKHTKKEPTEFPCLECEHNRAVNHYEPMTNADRIRNMSDTELADFVTNIHQKDIDEYEYVYIVECTRLEDYEDILQWLQAEVKEGADDECN